MPSFAISSAKQGMSRQRNKGGAAKDSFFTLHNCYVTSSRSIVPRPGTVGDQILPLDGDSGLTKGLMAFDEHLYVFSAEPVTLDNPLYRDLVLQHPDPDSTAKLLTIEFAQPFLGYPYVVASFDDDPTKFYHYWLQGVGSWEANHVYMEFESVEPTVQNGYTYQATRLNPAAPNWAPNKQVEVGDVFEPTVPNGYQYEIIDIIGDNPATGNTEPTWIASDGAIVYEDVDNTASSTTPPPTTPPLPPNVPGRYGGGPNQNPGGTRQNQA